MVNGKGCKEYAQGGHAHTCFQKQHHQVVSCKIHLYHQQVNSKIPLCIFFRHVPPAGDTQHRLPYWAWSPYIHWCEIQHHTHTRSGLINTLKPITTPCRSILYKNTFLYMSRQPHVAVKYSTPRSHRPMPKISCHFV